MSTTDTTPILFWFDDHLDAAERAENPELALHAVGMLEHGWHGYHVPIITGAELRRFIAAWARNDPNGTWSDTVIHEGDGALVMDSEVGREMWRVHGLSADGQPVYPVDGWTWHVPSAE